MSEERRDRDYLSDLLEAMQRIVEYTSAVTRAGFLREAKTQDAVVRNLEVIGEAAKHLSPEIRDAHPGVPWRKMAGMRDRLIHGYFGVSFDIVWTVARKEIPDLLPDVTRIVCGLHDAP